MSIYQSRLYQQLSREGFLPETNPFPEQHLNNILNKSSMIMDEIPNNSVHLMVTSPPYNVSKEYEQDLSLQEYKIFLSGIFSEVYRVLVPGGRACVNIANIGRKPYIPLSDYVSQIMIGLGFSMRGEIIWNKAASVGSSTAWGSWQSASNPTLRDVHEYILVFSKGDYARKLTKEEKLVKHDTITKEQFMEWTKSIWTMKTASAKKIGHPAPFPEELPSRLIQLYSFTGDVVLDPFMGSGTTAVAAMKAQRNYVGYELDLSYVQLAVKRIQAAVCF